METILCNNNCVDLLGSQQGGDATANCNRTITVVFIEISSLKRRN